jgi:hypothetical protein
VTGSCVEAVDGRAPGDCVRGRPERSRLAPQRRRSEALDLRRVVA